MLEIDIKLLPFQGVTNERALTQGVASLALGYVHHWAFSPSLLNPKLQLLSFPFKMNLGAELLRFVARSAAKVLMPHRGNAYIWDSNPSLTLSAESSGSTSTLLTMRNIASFKRCPSSSIAFPENTKHLRQYNRLNILCMLSKVNVPSRWLNLESVRGFTFNNAENDRLDLKPHLP